MCRKVVGTAVMDEQGWLEFDDRAFLAPGDEPKNTVRYTCPKHGLLEVAHDVIRFQYREREQSKENKLVLFLLRDGIATY